MGAQARCWKTADSDCKGGNGYSEGDSLVQALRAGVGGAASLTVESGLHREEKRAAAAFPCKVREAGEGHATPC